MDVTWDDASFYFVEGTSEIHEGNGSIQYEGVFADLTANDATSLVSIDYDPTNQRLLVLDNQEATIYVVDMFGDYVEEYDISGTVTLPLRITWDDTNQEILVYSFPGFVPTIYELDDEGVSTGTSYALPIGEVGIISGIDVADGYLWATSDTNWSIYRLDRDDGSTTGFVIDVSGEGSGNPTGLDYVNMLGTGLVIYVDTGVVYIYEAVSDGGSSMAPALTVTFDDEGGEEDPPARELRLQGGVRLMDGVRLY